MHRNDEVIIADEPNLKRLSLFFLQPAQKQFSKQLRGSRFTVGLSERCSFAQHAFLHSMTRTTCGCRVDGCHSHVIASESRYGIPRFYCNER